MYVLSPFLSPHLALLNSFFSSSPALQGEIKVVAWLAMAKVSETFNRVVPVFFSWDTSSVGDNHAAIDQQSQMPRVLVCPDSPFAESDY